MRYLNLNKIEITQELFNKKIKDKMNSPFIKAFTSSDILEKIEEGFVASMLQKYNIIETSIIFK